MSSNNQKNALITGAAKRVGRAIAIDLAEKGWNIAIHHNTTDASEVAKECEAFGVKVTVIKADLNNHIQTKKIFQKANEALGKISLLINNASIFEQCNFADTEEDLFDRHMNINFKAPFFLTQDFAKQCKSDGHIINICDTKTIRNKTIYSAYLLSKKALRDFSKMTAAELAPNIRCNAILPGVVEEFSDNFSPDLLEKRQEQLPMKKIADKKHILDTVSYLQNSSLTGQEIFIDGGEQLI